MITLRKILAFSSVLEAGTALLLMFDPALVVRLLVGAEISGIAAVLGRCFGITLLALSLACWPGRERNQSNAGAWRGLLAYNALIALFLAYLFAAEHMSGILLWPAVVLHALVALLLLWTWRGERGAIAAGGSPP